VRTARVKCLDGTVREVPAEFEPDTLLGRDELRHPRLEMAKPIGMKTVQVLGGDGFDFVQVRQSGARSS
jgi:hypothetical protein